MKTLFKRYMVIVLLSASAAAICPPFYAFNIIFGFPSILVAALFIVVFYRKPLRRFK